MAHIEGEEAIDLLNQMFEEYHLDEYKQAWEAMKADWDRVCTDNRKMRLGEKINGKGTAA